MSPAPWASLGLSAWQAAAATALAVAAAFVLIYDRNRVWTFDLMCNIHAAVDAAYRRKKAGEALVRLRWWVMPITVVTDPRKASRVVNNEANFFDYTLPVWNALWGHDRPMLMSGNAVHKSQRKTAAFMLTPDFAEQAREGIRTAAAKWVRRFDDGDWHHLNIHDLNQLTWDMLAEISTGGDSPCYRDQMLQEVHNARTAGMVSTVLPFALPLYAWIVRRIKPEYHAWEKFVRSRIAMHRSGERKLGAIMAKLCEATDDDDEVFGVIAGLHVAGHHAPSAAITFALYHLLRDEQAMALVKARLSDNSFLTQVLHETVRLYPGGVVSRFYTANRADPSLGIEAGEMVVVPWYSFHRDPDLNPNPETFDPERKQNAGNFFPFGLGVHSCIGQRIVRPMFEEAIRAVLTHCECRLDDANVLKFHSQLVTAEPDEVMHSLMWARKKQSLPSETAQEAAKAWMKAESENDAQSPNEHADEDVVESVEGKTNGFSPEVGPKESKAGHSTGAVGVAAA